MSGLTGADLEQRMNNKEQFDKQLKDKDNVLDLNAIYAGAQREEEERTEQQRKIKEKQAAIQEAEAKKINDLLAKVGDSLLKEKEEQAEIEIKKETEKKQAEIEAKIKQANNLKSDKQVAEDDAYKKMLGSLKL